MGELGLPVWGVGTLVGLPLTVLLFMLIQIMRGEYVSRKQLDAVQKVSDSWQHAWEVSEQTKQDYAELLRELTAASQTMEKVLNALPPSHGAETRSGGSS